ncbi:WD repeat domain-containing protein 83 [Petromyzon marinus]|uniref:WD repeat domain-containing protein 83 n=1 Tax=Petromyzon marinus TaxID=7757 RepID=A0AAJ7T7V7_PETMA|nr:WD repeat domain-containing protein 83 [Petromyzon marinus]
MAFPLPRPRPPELPSHRMRRLACGQGAVRAVRFNVDGNYCLTCGSDKSLKLWNPETGRLLHTYSGHGYEVLDAAGSCDNSQLTSCSSDKTVALWDVASGHMLRKLRGHAGKVNCVRFNEESTVILSGSEDTSVRCWDVRTRGQRPIQTLSEATDGVTGLDVTQGDIITGSVDGRVRRYDLRMGQLHTDFVGSPVVCVAMTRDSQCCLSSALDSTLRLMDNDTGELLSEYTGHVSGRYNLDCALSERDTHVVSGSEDGKVYFWDLVQASLALTLVVGSAVVHSLSFHPSSPILLTASEGTVDVWMTKSDEEKAEEKEGAT